MPKHEAMSIAARTHPAACAALQKGERSVLPVPAGAARETFDGLVRRNMDTLGLSKLDAMSRVARDYPESIRRCRKAGGHDGAAAEE